MQLKHGSLEGAILTALWDLEQQGIFTNSVKDVFNILAKNDSEKRAYTTIKTVMDRLVEKKLLMRYRQTNKYFYRTVYSNTEIVTDSLIDLAQKYLNGDLSKLSLILNSIKEDKKLISV